MSPALDPGARRGRIRLDAADHHGAFLDEACRVPQPPRNRGLLRGDADEGTAHAAVAYQFAEHEIRGVGGDRKTDALCPHDHRGIHADDFAVRRHQRTAGIAGIERGVGLDDVVDEPAVARAQRAAERRDHAGGHRRFETERIADGDHELATFEALGIAERRGRQRHRLDDPHQSEVGVGVIADEARGQVLAVRGCHLDAGRRTGDMAVGQDQPVGRHDDARSSAAAGRASGLSSGWFGVDGEADHGRADTIDHVDDGARIGIEERLVLDRDGGVFAGGGPAAAPAGIG